MGVYASARWLRLEELRSAVKQQIRKGRLTSLMHYQVSTKVRPKRFILPNPNRLAQGLIEWSEIAEVEGDGVGVGCQYRMMFRQFRKRKVITIPKATSPSVAEPTIVQNLLNVTAMSGDVLCRISYYPLGERKQTDHTEETSLCGSANHRRI